VKIQEYIAPDKLERLFWKLCTRFRWN
jgi:hypothetical protein